MTSVSPNCPQEGVVYAVEFSHRSGRDLLNVAKKRTNVVPVIEDARHPHKYRMLIGQCPFRGVSQKFGVSWVRFWSSPGWFWKFSRRS